MPPEKDEARGSKTNGHSVVEKAKPLFSAAAAHFDRRTPSRDSYLTQELRRVVRERKDALGATFPAVDDASGLGDGHCAHIFAPHSPTARREPTVATWNLLFIAMFGRNFRLTCEPGGPLHSSLSTPRNPADHPKQIRHWREVRYFREMGSRGGKAAAAKGEKFLKKRALRAAKARWQRHRIKSKKRS